MNYLAHALLADFTSPLRAGSATGDFFKGPLAPELPADFALGIRLHRAIDIRIVLRHTQTRDRQLCIFIGVE